MNYVSERKSGNGSVSAFHFPQDNHALVQNTQEEDRSPLQVPFNFGLAGGDGSLEIDAVIEAALSGNGPACNFGGEETIDGRLTWVIGGENVRFWVDPERGFLPLRWDFPNAALARTLTVAECSNGRWLPTRVVTVLTGAKSRRAGNQDHGVRR